MTFIPGLLQTPEFTNARADAELLTGPVDYTVDKAVQARASRQRMLRRPGGPSYEVILDEVAVRRAAAPREVVKAQLFHLAAIANQIPKVTLLVLPVEADIADFSVPRSAFSIYTFADPGDPNVVVVDNLTDDLVLTDKDEVRRYEELYDRLRNGALPQDESLTLVIDAARSMAD